MFVGRAARELVCPIPLHVLVIDSINQTKSNKPKQPYSHRQLQQCNIILKWLVIFQRSITTYKLADLKYTAYVNKIGVMGKTVFTDPNESIRLHHTHQSRLHHSLHQKIIYLPSLISIIDGWTYYGATRTTHCLSTNSYSFSSSPGQAAFMVRAVSYPPNLAPVGVSQHLDIFQQI